MQEDRKVLFFLYLYSRLVYNTIRDSLRFYRQLETEALIMQGKYTTDNGKVLVDNSVIAKVAGMTALECFGIVGMAALSKRDGLVKLLTRNSITKGIKVEVQNNDVFLEFHVIIAFGVSIETIAKNLMDTVKYQVKNLTGFTVKKISIIVEGVRVID